MRNFLQNLFGQLRESAARVVLREIRGDQFTDVTGKDLLERIAVARANVRRLGLQPGDRCAILGPNSIQWIAVDLALMAESAIVVPLYSRLPAPDLVATMKDCGPRFLFASDPTLSAGVAKIWTETPTTILFAQALEKAATSVNIPVASNPQKDDSLVTIIYTSGTSGEPKGVCLSTANVTFMLRWTTNWMDRLVWTRPDPIRVFQYLPMTFAASWILMMSCLSKRTVLTLSTDMNKVADAIRLSAPDYFLNVPTLLERVRRGVDDVVSKRSFVIRAIYRKACVAWKQKRDGPAGKLWLALGHLLIFKRIRAGFGANLRGLLCGSAPPAPGTQDFFAVVGIPIWQAYGLTETCGICTMDDPRIPSEPGRVGQAIPGVDLTVGENDEILAHGPNIFPGYWNRTEETARVLRNGVFHTGDQGEVNAKGNWAISGRIKNLIILNSGHKIAPEPIEAKLEHLIPGVQQVVVVGNGRGYLSALMTGDIDKGTVRSSIERANSELPHYRQVRNFLILKYPLTAEKGLLTATGKVRRDAVSVHFAVEVEEMYKQHASAASGSLR